VTSFLASQLPPPSEIVELPEDELGLRLLRLIVEHQQGHLASRHSVGLASIWQELGTDATTPQFLSAMVEAWDWLAVNRLVARMPGETGEHAYVTRRGHRILQAADGLVLLRAEARIDVDLHPSIAGRVRTQFLLGEYELAALAALRQVEIRVRQLAGASESDIGRRLMRDAFKTGGPLADPNADPGEQAATSDLFAGAIGVFKNPSSHREVKFDDPTYASEVVLFADLLLRMLDGMAPRVAFRHAQELVAARRADEEAGGERDVAATAE
jgi:uncharacterized protein (TIGR02391 family)